MIEGITQYGFALDPVSNQMVAVALPSVEFSYADKPHYTQPFQGDCFIYKYLTGVTNGYGGTTEFTYNHDGRVVGSYDYGSQYFTVYPDIGLNYFVTQVANNDGRGHTAAINYSYNGRCYNQTSGDYGPKCAGEQTGAPEHGNIGGHSLVSVTINDYDGSPRQRQITSYHTDNKDLFGRMDWQEMGVPHATNPFLLSPRLTRADNNYTTEVYANGGGSTDDDVTFTFTNEQVSTQYYINGENTYSITNRTTYAYDPAQQGGVQYGNLTRTTQYDEDSNVYRTSVNSYFPNTNGGLWLVNKPAQEKLYAGNENGELLKETYYYYDNHTHNEPPTKGELYQVETGLTGAPIGGSTNGLIVTSQMAYDEFGNIVTSVTPSNAETTVEYDNFYYLYPVKMTVSHDELDDRVTYFDIYGFPDANGTIVPRGGLQNTPGLLKEVRSLADVLDPNKVIRTGYEYDPFGRLYEVYDDYNWTGFGDAQKENGDPVARYRYFDNLWNDSIRFLDPVNDEPFYIATLRRPETYPNPNSSNGGYAYIDQTFYDGLGRPVQGRSVYAEVDGQSLRREIIATTAYNALGQVVCQTVPYDIAFYADRGRNWPDSPFVPDACIGQPHTSTNYDVLGRPLTVISPDGSQTQYNYAINETITVDDYTRLQMTQVVDANGHITNNFSNLWGQLVLVREIAGAGNNASHYADTRYSYDPLGNLETVTTSLPTDNHPTTWLSQSRMFYDALGRKTSMEDPDMGSWTYGYDASGNLIRQEANIGSANGHVLCFYYDGLNRLLRKVGYITQYHTVPPCPSLELAPDSGVNHLASYIYDTAEYGLGQSAQESWGANPVHNYALHFYDTMARPQKQIRWIDNRPFTIETPTYDALNRPTQMKYPNNDVVNIGYDREGENSLTLNGLPLVTNIASNERGQLTQVQRGNSTHTVYNYFDDSGNFRLQAQDTLFANNDIQSFQYQYDAVGNILRIRDIRPNVNEIGVFANDSQNRLTTAAYSERAFFDDFGNGNNWQEDSSWEVSNGVYRQTDSSCDRCSTKLSNSSWTNVQNFVARFSFKYTGVSQPHALFLLEFRGDASGDNSLAAGIRPNTSPHASGVWHKQNGNYGNVLTPSSTTKVPVGEEHIMQVVVIGNRVRLYRDNTILVDTTVNRNVAGNFFLTTIEAAVEVDDLTIHQLGSGYTDAFSNGSNWAPQPANSSWQVVNNAYRQSSDSCNQCTTRLNTLSNVQNFTARFRFKYNSVSTPSGVLLFDFRGDANDQNAVAVGIRPNNNGGFQSGVWQKVNDDYGNILAGSATTVPLGTWHTLQVTASGTNIRLYLNDQLLVNTTVSRNVAGSFYLTTINSAVDVDDLVIYPYATGFTDTFSSGGNWASLPGGEAWTITGGVYRHVGNDCTACSTRLGISGFTNLSNQVIRTRLRYNSTSHASSMLMVEFRGDGANSVGVAIRPNNNGGYESGVWVKQNGNYGTAVATNATTIPMNTWHDLVVQAVGNTIRLYLNDNLLIETTVNRTAAGDIRLTTFGADVSVDDFQVYPVSQIFSDTFANSNNWSPLEWVVANGMYQHVGNSCPVCTTRFTRSGYTNLSNVVIRSRFRYNSMSDPSSMLMVEFRGDSGGANSVGVAIRPNNNGGYGSGVWVKQNGNYGTAVATHATTVLPGLWHDLMVEAVGNKVRLYLNDNLLIDTTVSRTAAGDIRLTSFGADVDVDDFAVYPVSQTLNDNFNNSNNWMPMNNAPVWSVSNGVLQATGGANCSPCKTRLLDAGVSNLKDVVIRTRFRYDNVYHDSSMFLVDFRGDSGGTNSVGAAIRPHNNGGYGSGIWVQQNGGYGTAVATSPTTVAPGSWHTLEVQAIGSLVRLYLDDNLLLTTSVNRLVTGNIRLTTFGANVTVDKFEVYALDNTATHPATLERYTYDEIGNITGRQQNNTLTQYTYPPARPHAVTALSVNGVNTGSFAYDAHGNMFSRVLDGSYTQVFDVENRLVSVNKSGSGVTQFFYDSAGQRVKTVQPDGTTIYYPFPGYEEEVRPAGKEESIVIQRTTYRLAGQAIAVKVSGSPTNDGLYYLHSDHLGSASVLSNASGGAVPGSEARYLPFGDWRTEPMSNPGLTDMGFTGHKHNNSGSNDLGLIYMNARYYMPGIGRFASADTIVPDPANPQSFNRYSYTYNNPLRYIDPSGHCIVGYSGEVLWDQGPYGTSGICPYTMHWIEEGTHAAYMAQQDPPCPGDCGLGFALFVTSFVPGVGEVMDVFDIGSAIVDGELDQAALIAILSFAPGRASAVLGAGTEGLKRLGLSDELAEGIIRTTTDCFGNSFSAGTMVMTKGGPKSIEEIQEGDLVLAYNEVTGEVGYYPVTDLISHIDVQVVYLTIGGETLVTTANHPFYTSEGIWLEAGELQLGDEIRTAVWTTGEVEASYIVTQPQSMYNFTVANAHTYFVGDGQWLVHNSNKCIRISNLAPDWATKGAHIHVQGVELAVRPGTGGTIVFEPVFSSTPANQANAAIKRAEEALATDMQFRQQLYESVSRGVEYLGQSGNSQWAAKSGELNFLKIALEKLGVSQ